MCHSFLPGLTFHEVPDRHPKLLLLLNFVFAVQIQHTFHEAFGGQSTQKEVFDTLGLPLVTDLLNSKNGTPVFQYITSTMMSLCVLMMSCRSVIPRTRSCCPLSCAALPTIGKLINLCG